MSAILHQCKNRLQCSTQRNYLSIDNELKNILNESRLLKTRFDKLEESYQQWIGDERVYLLKRIEKLENENHQLHEIYQTYQMQNEKSIRSITNLIIKILLTQQELRKQYSERHNANDSAQWRKERQQDKTVMRSKRSISCHVASSQSDDSRYTINDQSIWLYQVKEQDQKTANYLSELNNHSSTLATVKSKTDKPSTALSNKLYYILKNEKTPSKSIRDNHQSTDINIVPIDDSNIVPHRKQQSSMTFSKNQSQTRSTYSNHERLPTQTPYRTPPIVKNTQAKTTTTTKPPRVPTVTIRPPTTNTRQRPPPPPPINQKTVSTTNKSPRPRCTLPKSSEPIRSTRPRPRQSITTKPSISSTKNIKTRIPIVLQQPAHVTDLDAVMAEQQTQSPTKLSDKPTLISPSFFSKNTVKLIRPVRSQELKLFSCHLTPEMTCQTNESLSTLTPSSVESITDNKLIKNKNNNSNTTGVIRDFSEDSLNEHNHIKKLFKQSNSINSTKNDNLQGHSSNDIIPISSNSTSIEQENAEMNIKDRYFLSVDDNSNPPYAPPSSIKKPKSISSLVHRLVFPERLGRMIFYRRILSDSDIYQKICSKDNEIFHNVYHLDTIRDYSMEYYMLTSYASDSQLRAWLDTDDDDEIIGHFNANRFQSSDEEINKKAIKRIHSSGSLIHNEELDWYSELELFNLTKEKHENTSSGSSEIHIGEFLPSQQNFTDSSNSIDLTSGSWILPPGTSNQRYSTPLHSDIIDQSNSILQEILNHSWTDNLSTSNSIQEETGIEQFENDSTSSIITDEFQSNFYYLCPITKTTSFTNNNYKT